MEKDKKKTRFIHQPEYPGGPKAISKFIYEQLRYPAGAVEANIEGTVLVDYDIDYQGNVISARMLQGIGHGCDEEACRLARLLKFHVPTNRNMKVTFHQKLRVQFKKPSAVQALADTSAVQALADTSAVQAPVDAPAAMQISYTVTTAPPAPTAPTDKPATQVYSYTVQL